MHISAFNDKIPMEVHRITLVKNNGQEDFGFSVRDGLYEEGIFVHHIRPGGPADVSGLLKPQDRILYINSDRTTEFDCCLAVPIINAAGDKIELVVSRKIKDSGLHYRSLDNLERASRRRKQQKLERRTSNQSHSSIKMDSLLANFESASNYFSKLTLSLPDVQCNEEKHICDEEEDNNSYNVKYIFTSVGLSSANKYELKIDPSPPSTERNHCGQNPASLQEQPLNFTEVDCSPHTDKTTSACSIRSELNTPENDNDDCAGYLYTPSYCRKEKECLLKVLGDLIKAF